VGGRHGDGNRSAGARGIQEVVEIAEHEWLAKA
jgi:hypothetical protein